MCCDVLHCALAVEGCLALQAGFPWCSFASDGVAWESLVFDDGTVPASFVPHRAYHTDCAFCISLDHERVLARRPLK